MAPLQNMSPSNPIQPIGEQRGKRRVAQKEVDVSDSDYTDVDGGELADLEMEGALINAAPRKGQAIKIAAVPKKHDRITSKLLNNVILELQSLDGAVSKEDQPSYVTEHHGELYLSSEEASSVSDYEGSLMDEDTSASEDMVEEAMHTRLKRSSQEAKAVQLTMVSKPRVVEIHTRSLSAPVSQHISPATPIRGRVSLDLASLATAVSIPPAPSRPSPLRVARRTSIRRTSNASMASTYSQESTSSRDAHEPYGRHAQTASARSSPPRRSKLYSLNTTSISSSAQNLSTQSARPAPYSPILESPHPMIVPYTIASPPSQSNSLEPKTPGTPSKRRNFFSAMASSRNHAFAQMDAPSPFEYRLAGASASMVGFGSRDGATSAHPLGSGLSFAGMSSIDLTQRGPDPFSAVDERPSSRSTTGSGRRVMRMSALGSGSSPFHPPPPPPQINQTSNRTSEPLTHKAFFSRSSTVPSCQSLPLNPSRDYIFEAGSRYSDESVLADKDIVRYEDIAAVGEVLLGGRDVVRYEDLEPLESIKMGEPVALITRDDKTRSPTKGGLGSMFKGRWRART